MRALVLLWFVALAGCDDMSVRAAGNVRIAGASTRNAGAVRIAGARHGTTRRVLMLAGQSNANGRGATSGLTDSSYGNAFAPVQMYIKSGGGVLDPQIWQVDVGPVDTDE